MTLELASHWLPHRGDMLLVDTVSAPSGGSLGFASARLDQTKPYYRNGAFASFWYLEIMAQGVGAVYNRAHNHDNDADPNFGYLIKIDSYSLLDHGPPLLDADLTIDVSLLHDLHPVGLYEVRLRQGERALAKAEMKFLVER